MQPLSVKEIETAVGGVWWNPQEGLPAVTEVSTDSRKITKGCLFIPLKGESFDGHDYIDAALSAGAAGVLCARLPADLLPEKFYIKVDDTLLALKALAGSYRERFDIPFIQITGSVGKTTTKEMIAQVLAVKFNVLKTIESLNNNVGTPQMLLRLSPEHQVAVIETGMGFAQYRQMKAQEETERRALTPAAPARQKQEETVSDKPRGNRAQQAARRQLTICERDIARAEERISALDGEMEAAACDYEKLGELVKEKESAQAELDGLYGKWEALSEEAEA